MKKIFLLSITSLVMLMADFTLEGDKLTPVSGTITTTTTDPVNTSGIIPNSVDLIWDDTYGGNTHFTTATSTGLAQYNPTEPPFEIGTSSYPVPTANMWLEVELEGTDVSCAHSVNQATNTRVEIGMYRGWWKDVNGVWHDMTYNKRGGYKVPATSGLTDGKRGCDQTYFTDERLKVQSTIANSVVEPGKSGDNWDTDAHIYVKPQNYYRWHGWGDKTTFATPTTAKAIVWQIYMRLVVDDPNKPDDRHLARYVAHTGTDRKDYDGTQMWNIEISRFKRITNDWQPFNLCNGIMSKAELEANPPPFVSVP